MSFRKFPMGRGQSVSLTSEKPAKTKRQPSPESEAIVSSDEDHECEGPLSVSITSAGGVSATYKPLRRPSWLSEVHSSQRKYSQGAGGSQPATPSADHNSFARHSFSTAQTQPASVGASLSSASASISSASTSIPSASAIQSWDINSNAGSQRRPDTGNSASSASFQWNSPVWNQQMPKASSALHSSRVSASSVAPDFDLQTLRRNSQMISPVSPYEDLRSPTSLSNPPDQLVSSSLPFEIPLEPSRKTVRSHSYSSGLKRAVLSRRTSRPLLYHMDSHDDISSLHEVEEDESKESNESADGSNLALSKTVSHPIILSPGTSPTVASPDAHTQMVRTPPAFPFSPISPLPTARLSEPPPMEILDSLREDQIAARTQKAAELAQHTPANAAAHACESSAQGSVRHDMGHQNMAFVHEHLFSPTGSGFDHLALQSADPMFSQALRQANLTFGDAYYSPPMAGSNRRQDGSTWKALYLVSFKSSRSEIHYEPEGSDLSPQPGDMVVVEGDRGQDMGVVKHANLSLEEAKALKADFNRKHYKSLVTFSRMFPHVAAAAQTDAELLAQTDAVAASNLADPRGRKDPNSVVPKLIMRIATKNEWLLLRDKEGNEARAKRLCQTKVNAHEIHMEILDAEFQLDYKKLTFYFYAEQYINFNDLVTELFKLWKTRIWLSAVNPASYPEAKPRNQQQPAHHVPAIAGNENAFPPYPWQAGAPDAHSSATSPMWFNYPIGPNSPTASFGGPGGPATSGSSAYPALNTFNSAAASGPVPTASYIGGGFSLSGFGSVPTPLPALQMSNVSHPQSANPSLNAYFGSTPHSAAPISTQWASPSSGAYAGEFSPLGQQQFRQHAPSLMSPTSRGTLASPHGSAHSSFSPISATRQYNPMSSPNGGGVFPFEGGSWTGGGAVGSLAGTVGGVMATSTAAAATTVGMMRPSHQPTHYVTPAANQPYQAQHQFHQQNQPREQHYGSQSYHRFNYMPQYQQAPQHGQLQHNNNSQSISPPRSTTSAAAVSPPAAITAIHSPSHRSAASSSSVVASPPAPPPLVSRTSNDGTITAGNRHASGGSSSSSNNHATTAGATQRHESHGSGSNQAAASSGGQAGIVADGLAQSLEKMSMAGSV